MDHSTLERAFASTQGVLAGVSAADLGSDTPCQSWKVRDLINHMVNAPRFGVHAMRIGGRIDEVDVASGDFRAAYDQTAADTLAAFAEPGALEKTVTLPFGDVPATMLMTMVTGDQFTHGWDLARATGQSTDLDPALAEQLLAEITVPDHFRGAEGAAPFAAVTEAPAGSNPADRFAAYMGRSV